MKKATVFLPVELMREIRLQKAYQLPEERRFATIAEVQYKVGMENASHFTKKNFGSVLVKTLAKSV